MKLSSEVLKRIIAEEAAKFRASKVRESKEQLKSVEDAAKDVEEVDADEYADSLAKHVDMMQALKIEETRLLRRLKKVRENKHSVAKKLANS